MNQPTVRLDNLAERHPGLTAVVAAYFHEAASVCLSRHHSPPIEFFYSDETVRTVLHIDWVPPDERTRQAWANDTDTTEAGAYACALAAVEHTKELVAIHRAQTETGADYYLAPVGKTLADLEECFRLEVSGTDLSLSEIQRRLNQKIKQALAVIHPLPAMAIVVGFKTLVIVARNAERDDDLA